MTQEEFTSRVLAMQDTLYRIATTILPQLCDREDAVQSAIERALRRRASLRDDRALEKWLSRILINECRTLLRRQKTAPLTLCEEICAGGDGEPGADLHLRAALRALPEKFRTPLLLHHLDGYSLNEIARILKLSPALVKSRLHQARGALRKNLKAGDEEI